MSATFTPAKIGKGRAVHMGVFTAKGGWTKCVANFNQTGGPGMQGDVVAVKDAEVTCKKCLKALAADAAKAQAVDVEAAHAEALAEHFERTHTAHWVADRSGIWTADGQSYVCDLPVRRGTFGHPGACYDRVAGVQRHALTLTPKQRKEARRRASATLRAQAPQTRAAARARRARRGTGRATAKSLLVAVGLPQDVAHSYASAFSRGTDVGTVRTRVPLNGKHASKVEQVKRYAWAQFAERLATYTPQDPQVASLFEQARQRVA